jgi:hypothetical protein
MRSSKKKKKTIGSDDYLIRHKFCTAFSTFFLQLISIPDWRLEIRFMCAEYKKFDQKNLKSLRRNAKYDLDKIILSLLS